MHASIHTNRLNIFGKFDKKYFAKFEERKQLYFPAVLMPTYPLGQLMTAHGQKPWNVFAHCSKLNYF